jgi:ubiquinone/menaquinone biosynthesis C-methylase UbiE
MSEDLKDTIKARYGAAAKAAAPGCSCGPSCCSDLDNARAVAEGEYSAGEAAALPAEALSASLGCGNPTALADLHAGETVLDLGSGGGIDVLLSARRVGPSGKVYGLDMTDEMLALARDNQRRAGVENVEFLKGEIEALPLPDGSVDVVISNCVVNLSSDKDRVFAEILRVLRPGGRLAISDVLFQGDVALIPEDLRRDAEAWAGCIAGALEERDCVARLERTGLTDVSVEVTNVYDQLSEGPQALLPEGVRLVAAFIRGIRPAA